MPNRGRNYMDRIFGRNEGSESRDFSDGRRYGERESFYDDEFRDSGSEWNRNNEFSRDDRGWDGRDREYQGRSHRTQASRNRPRANEKSDYERDYSVRRDSNDYRGSNPNGTARGFDYNIDDGDHISFRENDDQNSFWNDNFNSERERGMRNRSDRNGSFYQNDFRNTNSNTNTNSNRGGFFGKGPKGWKRSDERIREEVSEALYRDYHVDASEIEVEVKEGIVTLTGSVDSRDSKRAAEECIENLSGVIDVHNRIRIADNNKVSNLRNNNDGEKRALS